MPSGDWNGWLLALGALLVLGLPPALFAVCRGTPTARLAGLSMTGTLVTVTLLLASRGFARDGYADLGVVLAILGPVGVLVFTRFLGGLPRDGTADGRTPGGGAGTPAPEGR
ncbi:MrpF/PhaF family protein [Streptomyces sp. NPDC004327]|uniref:MrpF/PhaF family protein n=1 Tax=Streptomyces sp. NPDC004327 TaxID=3364699 RepID=UPI0036A0601D